MSAESLHTPIDQSLGFAMYGHSMDNTQIHSSSHVDEMGYLFFTRPQLNLSTSNIQTVREFAQLLTSDYKSVHRWIRCTLDPRLSDPALSDAIGGVKSAFVKNDMAFIPLLSEAVVSVTGWPVRAVTTYTSSPGKHKEVYMQVDGRSRKEGPVNLTFQFQRLRGNLVSQLLETWGAYPEYVVEGLMDPYMDFVLASELDYNIRVFRFIMGGDGKTIIRIGSTLPGIIMVAGGGDIYDYNKTKSIANSIGDTVSIPMKFPAVEQNDPVIMRDFNQIAETFKPEFLTKEGITRIDLNYRGYFKGYLYPYINLLSSQLEAWVSDAIFELVAANLVKSGIIYNKEEVIEYD